MLRKNKSNILIGTSGYSYKDWLGNFYPQFCPQADFLRFYSSVFNTVEIDSTYYRVPSVDTVKKWKTITPDKFIFTAKFPSSVTHEGDIDSRLKNARGFIDTMRHLDHKLGPLLMQFPYGFKPEENWETMNRLIENIPEKTEIALEVRNRKWLKPEFYKLLKSKNISLVRVDHPWMPKQYDSTGDFMYIRLLGDRKKIPNDFSYIRDNREEDLKWWQTIIEEFSRDKGEVYTYFNNHYTGHSPTSAIKLLELINQ